MPSRIIREGILTSEAVNSLSPLAELFYRRLQSVADDYGRYFAHLTQLRVNCFPSRPDSVTESDIKKWLDECCKAKGADGEPLVKMYGGDKFILLTKFGQQTRSKSKFPDPQEEKAVKQESKPPQAVVKPTLIKDEAIAKQMFSLFGVGDGVGDGTCTKPTEKMEKLKPVLLRAYSRRANDNLSSMEEAELFQLSRRPDALAETAELFLFRTRNAKFFPRSLSALLSDWQKHLDHARQPLENESGGSAASEKDILRIAMS